MKNFIVIIFIIGLLSFNIIACDKQQQEPIKNNEVETEEKKEGEDKLSIGEDTKNALVENLKKYFDIEIKKENFEYSLLEDIDKSDVEKEEMDDLEEVCIVAHLKDKEDESKVGEVEIKYNENIKAVEYMKVLKFEENDENATLTMESAIPISEKFFYDKGIIPLDTKLKPEAITNNNGMSVMEFSYILNNDEKDIKIGLNSLNKEVRMFDIN